MTWQEVIGLLGKIVTGGANGADCWCLDKVIVVVAVVVGGAQFDVTVRREKGQWLKPAKLNENGVLGGGTGDSRWVVTGRSQVEAEVVEWRVGVSDGGGDGGGGSTGHTGGGKVTAFWNCGRCCKRVVDVILTGVHSFGTCSLDISSSHVMWIVPLFKVHLFFKYKIFSFFLLY